MLLLTVVDVVVMILMMVVMVILKLTMSIPFFMYNMAPIVIFPKVVLVLVQVSLVVG